MLSFGIQNGVKEVPTVCSDLATTPVQVIVKPFGFLSQFAGKQRQLRDDGVGARLDSGYFLT